MFGWFRSRVWAFSLVAVFWGCSGPNKQTTEEKKEDAAKAGPTDPEPTIGGPGEIVRKFDLNKDKKADLWKIYVRKGAGDASKPEDLTLVRIEIDLNGDGKVDVQRFYENNVKVREKFDLDYDGKFDLINHFSQGFIIKQEYFLRTKAQPDMWKYFEIVGKGKTQKTQLVRKERDENVDGKPDYWEYWENGQLDRIGRDTDFDGKVDVWERAESSQP